MQHAPKHPARQAAKSSPYEILQSRRSREQDGWTSEGMHTAREARANVTYVEGRTSQPPASLAVVVLRIIVQRYACAERCRKSLERVSCRSSAARSLEA
jgi:hypothetical protein